MKIFYIITRSDTIGGAQIHVYDLAKKMHEQGHDVTVLVGGKGVFYNLLAENGLNVIELKKLKRELNIIIDFLAVIELIKIFRKTEPNLVTLHSSKAGLIGRIACFLLRVPTIFTVHGWSFAEGISERKRKVFAFLEKLLGKISTHIITVSEADKKLALDLNVVNQSHMTAIHNGVKPLKKINQFRKTNTFKLISVARFSEQKDHETLLRALSLVSNRQWELDLVGDGPLENDMVELAEKLGISGNLNFLGLRKDVPDLLSQADMFVLISNWEGLPLSILEAMSIGLPIIASDVGGVNESVKDGFNGRIISRGDTSRLKDVLEETIENEKLLDLYGHNSKSRFEEEFTFKRQFEKTYELYQQYSK